jgi:DNA primase
MKIPEEIIEEINRQADIVEIIGEYVDLKRRGANFVGLCPFHNEKTPSFNVSQEKGIYKCFGCGKAGNAVGFLMDYTGMNFPEAMESLAGRLGIEIPKISSPAAEQKQSRRSSALKAIETAGRLYHSMLGKPEGQKALKYYYKRNFGKELIKKFKLGYAPDSWNSTLETLKKRGFSEQNMLDAGLIIERDNGGHYDRFRDRAMFPIRDFMGRPIGFGARRMSEDSDQPKYINSPQSLIYDKSRSLYGLFEAKNSMRNRREAILVEGYADVLTLHQAGFDTAIASSGTALTPEQLDVIARYCKKIYMVYDADEAGTKAARKGTEIALAKGFEVLIVTLPPGEDPDSMILENGADAFRSYLRDASGFVDYFIEYHRRLGRLNSPEGKAEAARELIRMIAKIPDRLRHDFYIGHLASLLGLSERELQTVYGEKSRVERDIAQEEKYIPATDEPESPPSGHEEKAVSTAEILKDLTAEEKLLISIALSDEKGANILFHELEMTPDKMISYPGKRIIEIIMASAGHTRSPLNLITANENIDEEYKQAIIDIAMRQESPSPHLEKYGNRLPDRDHRRAAEDSLLKLEMNDLLRRRSLAAEILKNASKTEDHTEALQKIMAFDQRINEIKRKLHRDNI